MCGLKGMEDGINNVYGGAANKNDADWSVYQKQLKRTSLACRNLLNQKGSLKIFAGGHCPPFFLA